MARDVATALLAAMQAATLRPRIFYEGQFRNPSTGLVEYLRFWSGLGTITWDGKTWTGAGNVLGVEGLEEKVADQSVGFKVSLNGLKTANLSVILDADQSHFLPGTIWLAAQEADGTITADPYLARSGLLNVARIPQDDGTTRSISAEYEDENAALTIPYNRRYTPEDQAIDDPTDRGFDMVAQLQDMVIAF